MAQEEQIVPIVQRAERQFYKGVILKLQRSSIMNTLMVMVI